MISRSSGCAATPRCDVRVMTPGTSEPSGIKISFPFFLSVSSMFLSLIANSFPFQDGQAGGGHGLTDAAAFLVGKMEGQPPCQVGELRLPDPAGFLQGDRPGLPRCHPAEDQGMADVVIIRIMADPIAKIEADVS